MRYLITVLFLIAAVINLLPTIGLLGPERLEALYGITLANPDLILLLRHRAVLFGLVGTLLVLAAFRPAIRVVAGLVGLGSMLSYLWLAWPPQEYGAALQRVFWVDVVGATSLLAALWLSRDKRAA